MSLVLQMRVKNVFLDAGSITAHKVWVSKGMGFTAISEELFRELAFRLTLVVHTGDIVSRLLKQVLSPTQLQETVNAAFDCCCMSSLKLKCATAAPVHHKKVYRLPALCIIRAHFARDAMALRHYFDATKVISIKPSCLLQMSALSPIVSQNLKARDVEQGRSGQTRAIDGKKRQRRASVKVADNAMKEAECLADCNRVKRIRRKK